MFAKPMSAALLAALFALPSLAIATNPHGDELPFCPGAGELPAECLVTIKNPGFDGDGSLVSWMPNPFRPNASRIEGDENQRLALSPGGSVTQVVPLPANTAPEDGSPYFLPALFARAQGGSAKLEFSVSVIHAGGSYEAFSHEFSVGDEWMRPSGGFDISRGTPTAFLIRIERKDDNAAATAYVDDVQVIRQR
jgi:hypothetical protein